MNRIPLASGKTFGKLSSWRDIFHTDHYTFKTLIQTLKIDPFQLWEKNRTEKYFKNTLKLEICNENPLDGYAPHISYPNQITTVNSL